MAGSDLVYIPEEVVQIVQALDALIQRVHHVVGVFRKLHGVDLFLLRPALAEFLEHV